MELWRPHNGARPGLPMTFRPIPLRKPLDPTPLWIAEALINELIHETLVTSDRPVRSSKKAWTSVIGLVLVDPIGPHE